MIPGRAHSLLATRQKSHLTFFRQGGWMMAAVTFGGLLMFLLHKVACRMPKEEYGLFQTLLAGISQLSIPAAGLQGIFTQQAAASLNPEHERKLAGMFRGVLRGTFFLWLMIAAAIFLVRKPIMEWYSIPNPAALWATLVTGLLMLWRPVVFGVLQGRQNFLWCGWVSILEGATRFGGVVVIVGLLGHYAAGAMTAVLAGTLIVVVVGLWLTRDCFHGSVAPMNWSGWLARIIPLTLGLGVCQFMLTADMLFVRRYFPADETGYYGAAGMIGRALIYFTGPLTMVMFPKVARSVALRSESSALKLTLALTALAGGGAALACTFFPSLPLRIVYDESFVAISAPLVPWFTWCMLPLTVSTVLINNLMARSRFSSVPWLVVVAVGYAAMLYFRHDSFREVIQILGCFNLILVAVCAWFSFHRSQQAATNSLE